MFSVILSVPLSAALADLMKAVGENKLYPERGCCGGSGRIRKGNTSTGESGNGNDGCYVSCMLHCITIVDKVIYFIVKTTGVA